MSMNIRPMRGFVSLLSLTAIIFGLVACAHLQPGADPLVVRVEQGLTGAKATFDMVLHVDNADRGFWRTNAPAFHNFCSWLRTPMPYTAPDFLTFTNMPRASLMQLNVQDLKLAYKASRTSGNSNALWTAWTVLDTSLNQASSWQLIVSTPVNP